MPLPELENTFVRATHGLLEGLDELVLGVDIHTVVAVRDC